MTKHTTRAGTFLAALGGVVAVLALLAGPAAAQTSGEAYAENGSVASGSADARNNSTASGDATARNGSTASGCSTAVNTSTASGDDCDDHKKRDHKHDGHKCPPPSNLVVFSDGSSECIFPEGEGRPRATATRATLALTGSWTASLAVTAAMATGLGLLLLISTSDRRRASGTR